ncbi:SgcJ/EcaC family oxidoreductase [Nocardia australiensis]|uniref:SgcJ/EcaC family oxidoreductase n=1 Tax=Nocardia australiensis TaxID=2887191 RepID=UPI001D148583|nr:SgcJ/EcaC family oxidoreductase [Nocardia australiensis]
MSTPEIDTQTRAADIEALEQIAATIEHSQMNELAEEFIGLFRHDAIWTTGGGRNLLSRDAIAAFSRKVLPGAMQGAKTTLEVVHVVFIRPDVAAVKVRQRRWSTIDGELLEDELESTPLLIAVKEEGRWQLVAGQNTAVIDVGE